MKEVIIDKSPVLDAAEKRTTDLHSVLNIINVLTGELSLVCSLAAGPDVARVSSLIDEIMAVAQDLRESDDVVAVLNRMRQSESAVVGLLENLIDSTDDISIRDEWLESIANLKSVYRIVRRRVDEMEARAGNPDLWVTMRTRDFERQFREVFYAIERNAKGRYRITFNLARKNVGDYYIDLKVESELQSDALYIPLRLLDVLRDLAANARKYTLPGGKVALAVFQSKTKIEVLVEDSGCGIPEDEIERVIEFGYRASNVRDRATMGGGFGMTKAAWLVTHWGGTMRISSGLGEGTRVRFSIPNRLDRHSVASVDDFSI